MKNKPALGKGIGALLGDHFEEDIMQDARELHEVDINLITPNALQPRKNFEQSSIDALSESIEQHGIIQPLLLHEIKNGYEIIAGERRWRAAKLAKLKTVPAIIMNPDEQKLYEVSLIENMQRENLNPIEEALAFQALSMSFSMTQSDIAATVGKSRSYISNSLRLLQLSEVVQRLLINKELSAGHAKVLVGLTESKQEELANKIIQHNLNVRDTEKMINATKKRMPSTKKDQAMHYRSFVRALEDALGSRVRVSAKGGKGHIEIQFYSDEDFERIYNMIVD